MSIPLPLLEGLLKLARRQYPDVERSMRLRGGILRHATQKDPGRTAEDNYAFRHKGQNWRCHVSVAPTEITTHALCWWTHGPKGHRHEALDAILFRGIEMPLHFDSHFFSRWGLRSELMGVLITNMMGFFRQYPYLKMHSLKKLRHGHRALASAIEQGLVYGRPNGNKLISCDTFVSLEMMNEEERNSWERLRSTA